MGWFMSQLSICVLALLGFVLPTQAQPRDDALPAGAIARFGVARYRNVGRVLSLAFSPDGKTLLAGAWDGSIRLWEVATGKELHQYAGHKGWVRSLAFAPDGKTFASGSKDKLIRIWETSTGKELWRLEGHRNEIQYLAYSPEGKLLVSWTRDEPVYLWDAASGRESRRINLPPGIGSVACSPNGKLLAYARFRTIALLDLATGKEVHSIKRPENWFSKVVFSSDATILAGITWYTQLPLHLWGVANLKELRSLARLEGLVWDLVFSPDRRLLATAEGDHVLRVWEVATRKERCRFPSPDHKPSLLAFSPDGRTLAQGSEDITVLLWDVTGLQGKDRPRSASLSAKDLQTLWEELKSAEAAAAYRAIKKLVAGSKDSIPFMQKHLRPVCPVDSATLARLVADLDSEDFSTREQATEQLEKQAELAEPELRRALRGDPPLERRQRIERLLERVSVQRDNPSPERLRMLRAVEALERMDAPAARRALEQYAKGAPAADLTKEAKLALERLAK